MQQTVFVISEDDAARASLTHLMRTEGLTSRSFLSARAFLDQLHEDDRGCVVADLRMPGLDGIALAQALGDISRMGSLIMITECATVSLAVRAMKAGMADFIERPFKSETILKAVRLALEAAHKHDAAATERAVVERRRKSLTERENQVLSLVVDGLSNKEAAHRLGISFRTVEIHRAKVMAKMRADSLSSLVRMTVAPALATGAIDTPYRQQFGAAPTGQARPTAI